MRAVAPRRSNLFLTDLSLTEGSQRLFKFVPDEFVAQLPPRCSTNDFVITMKMKKNTKKGRRCASQN
ncbi:hypothetical protein EE530_14910 [Salmonella enterica]|nr:hypothetical protein [Salmonella enterica subsp. enterica]EAO9682009.1 hypothetical protein [Salmonella enterica]EBQ5981342.1 hypothetical protein [Salmonella enterica subsp. houtenae serovar Houten]ECE0327231.1 hypothetical protein [Salmonella enterica subsp. houtenae]EAT1196006.1 hypothetical protein [Salmonella enterica]